MSLRWRDGRLWLADGSAIEIGVRGPGAHVRWLDGALELQRTTDAGGGGGDEDETVELVLRHPIAAAEQVWIPHLAPEPGMVIGDAVFRAPAVVIASASVVLVFIVDVDDVARADGWRAWLDYEHPSSTLTLAAGAYREGEQHVLYERCPARLGDARVALRLHVLASEQGSDCDNPYGLAARWLWERWGRPGCERAAPAPLSRLMERVVQWAFASGWSESVWQSVQLPGTPDAGAPVFIVDVGRHPSVPRAQRGWREPRSIWNQAWFSTQRCANGLLRYARQVGSAELEQRARQMTRIALAAPQRDGLFPAVLIGGSGADGENDPSAWRWSNSNRRPPGVSEHACHIVDAAFSCRMLLEWHALSGDAEALAFVERFCERLIALQQPSGAFPGWVEPDGSIPGELAEGPESAVAVALLFELAERHGAASSGDASRLIAAARRGLPWLSTVAREGRWEDFETFYSCSRWGASEQRGRRVVRNGVYKQNTLSIAWCAQAFLCAARATGEAQWRRLARRCLDELSLYQAVWDPPFLPAPAHGGFGVMNADCEWNDARQSLFAPLYLELGRELGDRELIERGCSALRASFSMMYCPENAALARAYEQRFPFFGPESYGFMMENQGHDLAQPIGTFTIFTWGNGSALAAAATVRDLFPELAEECGLS